MATTSVMAKRTAIENFESINRILRKSPPSAFYISSINAMLSSVVVAILLEQNDEWQLQSRYIQVEALVELNAQRNEAQPAPIPPRAT